MRMMAMSMLLAVGCAPTEMPAPIMKGPCDAAPVQGEIGQKATPAFMKRVQAAAGAKSVRLIRPGMMVTMDYRADRMNVTVDDANRVMRIACG